MDRTKGFRVTDANDKRGRSIRAAIYTRLSADPHGTRLAVQRQEKEARELCARRGWEVAAVFEDDDISAFSGKIRPRYQEMLSEIEAGTLDAVVAWHPDRLHRSPKELERFIDLVEACGAAVATVQGGDYDLTTAGGRMTARVVGAVARHESEHKSERLKLWWQQRREHGTGYGSNRPFGWTDPKRSAVVEEEANLIREARDRLLAGDTLLGIARDWRQRGLKGSNGAPWSASTLRMMMMSAAISGRQEVQHDGKGQRQRKGRIVGPAGWEAIISPADADKIRSKLSDPSRRTSTGRPAGLLLTGKTGVARCGLCGAPLLSRLRKQKLADGSASVVRAMLCYAAQNRGCGRLMIRNDPVERIVTDAVLTAVDDGALAALLKTEEDREALAELAEVEQQMVQDRVDWAAGTITRAEWEQGRAVLQARKTDLERRLERSRRSLGLEGLPAGPLRTAWDAVKDDGAPVLSLVKKRAVIAALVESVTIAPATSRRFQPERISINWRA